MSSAHTRNRLFVSCRNFIIPPTAAATPSPAPAAFFSQTHPGLPPGWQAGPGVAAYSAPPAPECLPKAHSVSLLSSSLLPALLPPRPHVRCTKTRHGPTGRGQCKLASARDPQRGFTPSLQMNLLLLPRLQVCPRPRSREPCHDPSVRGQVGQCKEVLNRVSTCTYLTPAGLPAPARPRTLT